jgi:hypothetical protein
MFSKIKGLIFEEAPAKPAAATAPPPVVASSVAPKLVTPPSDTSKYTAALDSKIAAKALKEYDYLKFMATQVDFVSIIPDEKNQFVAAFKSAKAMGVTKEKLIETAGHYLAVIQEELAIHAEVSATQLKEKVEQSERSVKQLEADIVAKQIAIEQLQVGITRAKADHDALAATAQEWRAKIEGSRVAFQAACDSATASIKGNVEKLNRYL